MKKIAMLFIALMSLVFNGCDNEHYDIDGPGKLEWTSQTLKPQKEQKNIDVIVIPAEGGTYTFTTGDNINPVICYVSEVGDFVKGGEADKSYSPKTTEGATEYHIDTPNIEVTVNKATMTVTIRPNTAENDRCFTISTETVPPMRVGLTQFRQLKVKK